MKIIITILVIASILSSEKTKTHNYSVDGDYSPVNEDTIARILEDRILTMEVYSMSWLFNAPNWIEKSVLYNGDSIRVDSCFYLEPADGIEFPHERSMDYHYKVTGQFYSEPFCPLMVYDPDSTGLNDRCLGRVFRFSEIEAIYHGNSPFDNE